MSSLYVKNSGGVVGVIPEDTAGDHTSYDDYLFVETGSGTVRFDTIRKGLPDIEIRSAQLVNSNTYGVRLAPGTTSDKIAAIYTNKASYTLCTHYVKEYTISTNSWGTASILNGFNNTNSLGVMAFTKLSDGTFIHVYFNSSGTFLARESTDLSTWGTAITLGVGTMRNNVESVGCKILEFSDGSCAFVTPYQYAIRSSGGTWGSLTSWTIDSFLASTSDLHQLPMAVEIVGTSFNSLRIFYKYHNSQSSPYYIYTRTFNGSVWSSADIVYSLTRYIFDIKAMPTSKGYTVFIRSSTGYGSLLGVGRTDVGHWYTTPKVFSVVKTIPNFLGTSSVQIGSKEYAVGDSDSVQIYFTTTGLYPSSARYNKVFVADYDKPGKTTVGDIASPAGLIGKTDSEFLFL